MPNFATEPCNRRFKMGDRAIVDYISSCGVCNKCRRGYAASYTSAKHRRATTGSALRYKCADDER